MSNWQPNPHVLRISMGIPVLKFYTLWLLVLRLAGARGAHLSKRAGGSRRVALLSSIFPVLFYAVVFQIAVPIGFAIGHLPPSTLGIVFLSMSIGWVLAPGVALLAGGLLAQLLFGHRPSPQNPAIG